MPTIFKEGPYRVYFYSQDCNEPCHVHIDRDNKSAKFWVEPVVSLEQNRGFSRHELREMEKIIIFNTDIIIKFWNEFCNHLY